jgi:hypothetical protein
MLTFDQFDVADGTIVRTEILDTDIYTYAEDLSVPKYPYDIVTHAFIYHYNDLLFHMCNYDRPSSMGLYER